MAQWAIRSTTGVFPAKTQTNLASRAQQKGVTKRKVPFPLSPPHESRNFPPPRPCLSISRSAPFLPVPPASASHHQRLSLSSARLPPAASPRRGRRRRREPRRRLGISHPTPLPSLPSPDLGARAASRAPPPYSTDDFVFVLVRFVCTTQRGSRGNFSLLPRRFPRCSLYDI